MIRRQRKSKSLSLFLAFQKLFGRKQATLFFHQLPDRRDAVCLAAQQLSTEPQELLRRLAKRLGIPVQQTVQPLDLTLLPDGQTLSLLRSQGALYQACDGVIHTLVCCDPELCQETLLASPGIRIALALWKDIEQAHAESEMLYKKEETKRTRQQRDAAQHTLRYLMEQAASMQAQRICLHLHQNYPSYTFFLPAAQEAIGEIAPELALPLKNLLARGDVPQEFSARLIKPEVYEVVAEKIDEPKILIHDSSANSLTLAPHEGEKVHVHEELPTVLLVDDHPLFGAVLKRYVKRFEVNVVQVESGAAALRYLTDHPRPLLIISDIFMPEIDGFELLQTLQKTKGWRKIPVIMLTSDSSTEAEVRALEHGAEALVKKTESHRILAAHVARILQRETQRKAA